MTLVSQIIRDAYRESNLIALAATPTSAETTEALRLLNRVFSAVFGDEMGEALQPVPIGRAGISRPSGYPWYDTQPYNDWFVPDNSRLILNLESEQTVYLSPNPQDGARFGVTDPNATLPDFNLIVDGNGRAIEGSSDITLDDSGGEALEWFYRADLANWQRLSTLAADDTWPFPEKFDDLFITSLAMRLNTRNAVQADPQSIDAYRKSLRQFRARYRQKKCVGSELGISKLPLTKGTDDIGGDLGNGLFDAGRPYP